MTKPSQNGYNKPFPETVPVSNSIRFEVVEDNAHMVKAKIIRDGKTLEIEMLAIPEEDMPVEQESLEHEEAAH